jgi:hypothetical protein
MICYQDNEKESIRRPDIVVYLSPMKLNTLRHEYYVLEVLWFCYRIFFARLSSMPLESGNVRRLP